MMRVKFNHFEKVAGLFVLGAISMFVLSLFGVALKQGWFDSKTTYTATFHSADGLHAGATVLIAGLRAGSVEEIDLNEENKIRVTFQVLSKFSDKVRTDSRAQLIRPFLLGDRVLEVTVGGREQPLVAPRGEVATHETIDVMTLLSGKQLGESLELVSSMMGNLKKLAEAFLDDKRTDAFVRTIDRIDPLVENLNVMSLEVIKLSRQATQGSNMAKVMKELAVTTRELNQLIPYLNEKGPTMGKDFEKLVNNMADLTEQFRVLIPAIEQVGPDLPRVSVRAVEALDEAVVLMKAMQKNFFVKGSVREVREEEKEQEKKRVPTNAP